MKGTLITLTLGESYNDRKEVILSCITVSRGLLKAISDSIIKKPSKSAYEALAGEKDVIRMYMQELTQLEVWRLKMGLEKNQPWMGSNG